MPVPPPAAASLFAAAAARVHNAAAAGASLDVASVWLLSLSLFLLERLQLLHRVLVLVLLL
jgi:hypothetical protein